MRALLASLALLAASCASAGSAEPSFPPTHLGIHVGWRGFDGGDWEPVDDHGVGGFEIVHEPQTWVVGLEAAIFLSEHTEDDFFVPPASTVDFSGSTAELSFGVHKEMPLVYAGVHPYVGGGLSLMNAEFRGAGSGGGEEEDDEDSIGLYLHGGVQFDASPALFVGLDLRVRGGTEVELLGEDRDTGYGQVAFVLGVRF